MSQILKNYIGQLAIVAFFQNLLVRIADVKKKGGGIKLGAHYFTGLAGLGKSEIMSVISSAVVAVDDRFHVVHIKATATYNDLVGKLVDYSDKHVIFCFDEIAQFLKGQSSKKDGLLREMLELGNHTAKDIDLGGNVIVRADSHKQLWLFASNDDPKNDALFGPSGRCITHNMEMLSDSEKERALDFMLKREGATLNEAAKAFLLTRCRPVFRAIAKLAGEAANYGKLTLERAQQMAKERGFFVDGWTKTDVKILVRLGSSEKGCQVNELAALTGETNSETTDRVRHLVAAGLVQSLNGRKALAVSGVQWLSALHAKQSAKKATKGKASK